MEYQAAFDIAVYMGFFKSFCFPVESQHINMLTVVLDSALVCGLFLPASL